MQGKLIVIEGTDGSGKATQSEILTKKLKEKKYPVAFLDFPQYGKPSSSFVEKYLNGEYGTVNEVSPRQASVFYAVDRYDASFTAKKWLREGRIVIANRYVASNLAHQGGKIQDPDERKKFFEWNEHLEYDIFRIPRPSVNIILFVPCHISQKLVGEKSERGYLRGKTHDIHEADLNHLLQTEKVYLELARLYPEKYLLIDCTRGGKILTIEEISKMVWETVEAILTLHKK